MSHQPHDDHDHQRGPDCGHVAVPHGDQIDYIDYIHDGHLHREHDGHWDEH